MFDISLVNWGLWLTTMVPLTLSAGPGNLMVATSGARSGTRRSLRLIAGLDSTYFLMACVVGLGLHQILVSLPYFTDALRLFGSAYVMWLGLKLILQPVRGPKEHTQDFSFVDGIVIQLGNVKGVVMLLVMFSTFIPPSSTSLLAVLLLSAALVSLNLLSHFLWVSLGSSIQILLRSNPNVFKFQNAAFGTMLILVAVWMFLRMGSL